MDDADYEQESESDYSDSDVSESEHRARPSKRSQASKSAAAAAAARRRNQLQTQATSSAIRPATVDEEYNRHAKLLQVLDTCFKPMSDLSQLHIGPDSAAAQSSHMPFLKSLAKSTT